jgi:hypothetical protein
MSVEPRHGGPRPGSGRKTLFSGKARANPVSVSLTAEGRSLLNSTAARLQLSNSDVVEALIRQHGRSLTFPQAAGPAATTERWAVQEQRLSVTFLRERTADSVRHLLRSFADKYKEDWARWQALSSTNSLTTPEVVGEFKRILGRWQAVRPRPLASSEALTDLIARAPEPLELLGPVDLRNLRQISTAQEAALIALWELVRTGAAGRGVAGCVGITKVVMLLTAGRIGPALDSRVRKAIGLHPIHDGHEWLNALRAISEDLNDFESRTSVRIEQLVEKRWRPVGVGRAYDMAAGPRPK